MFALAVVCAAPGSARAQAHDPAAAEMLFRDGRAAAQKGDWETACPKFRESQRLDPAAGTLLNLADCEEHRGKVATSWELFRQLIDVLPSGDERLALAKQRAGALEKRLPRLIVRLAPDAPTGTRVRRNDVELSDASFGSPLPVDPGVYAVVVTAPGRQRTEAKITVAEGATASLDVSAGPPAPDVALIPVVEPHPSQRGSSHTAGWVIGGFGVAGLVMGTVAGIATLSHKSTVDDNCNPDTKKCNSTGYDAAQSGKTLGLLTTIGLAAGAAGVGIGAYLLLSGSSEPTSTRVGAELSPGGATFAVQRSF
jgi:hypothetical protein